MLHQCHAQVRAHTLYQAEHPRMQPAGPHRRIHRLRHDLARPRMGRMPLHHDRAACRQGRGRIPARRRKGQGKVRGPEYRHRAQRALHHADIRARQGLPLRQGHVMAQIKEIGAKDMPREQPELPRGPPPLALQPRGRQARLGRSHRRQIRAPRLDLIRDPLQKGGPRGPRQGRIAPEGRLGRLDRARHLGRASAGEDMALAARRLRGEAAPARNPFPGDQMFPAQHGSLLCTWSAPTCQFTPPR